MRNGILIVAVVLITGGLATPPAQADPPVVTEVPSGQGLTSLFDVSKMEQDMMSMVVRMLDTYLEYLTKPETAKKLAKFQKNYYDALVEEGFTPEQAFELVRGMGNPLQIGGGGK